MKLKLLTLLCLALLSSGCTENNRAKVWGGEMKIQLPPNTKLITATWKESQLWYLTRPMHSNEAAETYSFIEKSGFGVLEGKVLFIETKQSFIY